ncbi:MAG: hypothetical protein A2349_04340 [Candidatus Edwardsbacteria bacterium RifOxyB12_full_52_30]|nr:MAG: hypothetical protein A2502_07185 [Candidatus Edwardsbacteria bacterium RifOxyC12_full_54_24]OGJ17605.1 MAG: hypothetical protein A2349_04340 [Candidatus Edwardsbacteria bacterium RifOxyB12_full_52_30]
MFEGMPTLKEIFGSPVLTNNRQLQMLLLLLPHIIVRDRINDGILFFSSFVNFIHSGGYLVRHTREDFKNNRPIKHIQQEVFDLLDNYFQTV